MTFNTQCIIKQTRGIIFIKNPFCPAARNNRTGSSFGTNHAALSDWTQTSLKVIRPPVRRSHTKRLKSYCHQHSWNACCPIKALVKFTDCCKIHNMRTTEEDEMPLKSRKKICFFSQHSQQRAWIMYWHTAVHCGWTMKKAGGIRGYRKASFFKGRTQLCLWNRLNQYLVSPPFLININVQILYL